MQRHIDTQIQALRQEFITMGLEVKASLEKAINSLKEDDKQAAKEVIEHDEVINNHETHLEKKTAQIIALQSPVAGDLREIISILKASSDLERLADHAVSIAKNVLLLKEERRDDEIDMMIVKMGDNVLTMLASILKAYTEMDEKLAIKIAEMDAGNDGIFLDIRKRAMGLVKTNPKFAGEGFDYLQIANHLERSGDYITNIAEWIVYTKKGKITELGRNDF
ncbi:PhoU family protein [Ligilactobacillus murinus DSM 20452 = NBRC 14221]|uniref:Phosphate-specific transport system accessory protein PhoU n=1 Tax=Ligilactobacillus murinus DSM 20452 = NBRC 14221 TaxID=1423772 RepID=A0A0R2B8Q6_9LACO|nr:phosphate signaling complex protein PhoU [Ligilactobacillus murinus]KRM74244.1 PhoU family protein [Ligilactobacillus murinus DSM 20452 = NBRC 14221]